MATHTAAHALLAKDPRVAAIEQRFYPPLKFCCICASPLEHRHPDDGDTHIRAVCSSATCRHIHYINPRIIVGTIPLWQDQGVRKVLLCQRNIEPRFGYWTLPAGFMEIGESTEAGALRETAEEAGIAELDIEGLYAHVDIVPAAQLHVFFLAHVLNPHTQPGIETQKTHYFALDDIPWAHIAFTSVEFVLRQICQDSAAKPLQTTSTKGTGLSPSTLHRHTVGLGL